ncbi:MAG: HK97 gp10 family phage protein [Clostridium perfringens]|uniref:hypothetical protein n=1 Tax=Veillonella sp. TaxID=1926307 RepID=UPI0028FE2F86|nr:hypothetical protein [Veillonella sp.]MDU2094798.1 HK97 gp10 family phage protein [Clostridium perfringens]MDU2102704.1 hypothetical protein [Veillonella sp.]
MSNVRVKVNKEAFLRDSERFKETFKNAMIERTNLACAFVKGDAVTRCPSDLGQLRASIDFRVHIEGTKISGLIFATAFYAAYVHQGTGIYAVNGDGRKTPWVYKNREGEFIKTIGQRPKPFLKDAVIKNTAKLNEIFQK